MLPIFFLIGFGALVGWVTAILHVPQDSSNHFAAYGNCIIAGAIGGGASGALYLTMMSTTINDYNAQVNALLFAIFGAVVCASLTLRLHKHSH